MKKVKIILSLFISIGLFLVACEPKMETGIDLGLAPVETDLSFTVTPIPGNDFKVEVTNTSSVAGIASWNFGNGAKATGETSSTSYNLKGDYTITMTLVTSGGSASKSVTYNQPIDNMALLLNDKVKTLIGTVDDPNGKTWVIDNEATGHFGVGPEASMDDPKDFQAASEVIALFPWWTAAPNDKAAWECYDDELTFIFENNTFKCIYKTNAKSYGRKEGVAAHGAWYTNIEHLDDTYDRTFVYDASISGLAGGWIYSEEEDGRAYITFTSDKVIYPMYDINSADNKYRLAYIEENQLVLMGKDGDDKSSRLFILKPKGYVKPVPSFDVTSAVGVGENTFDIQLANVLLPGGATIAKVAVVYGDGTATEESTDYNHVFTHQFVHKGNYPILVTITDGKGNKIPKTYYLNVANNLSTYVPYLINFMVMYNDFGETQLVPVLGQDCSVSIVANPDKTMYPNRSTNVSKYTKTGQQWANAYMLLPYARRFDIATVHTFKILVYGTAGDEVLLKLENTDLFGNAWQTGTFDVKYAIQQTNKWEVATFEFAGIGAGYNWTGLQYTSDITTDPLFNTNYYNVIRIMLRPGDGAAGPFTFYFDDLAGPHVEGLK